MNIQEAKQEIIHTLQAYHRKDAAGRYCFPLVRQRPILLIGPPGIGKTAIMEQIAQECGIGLVAYTITHHTRQSAIGLPEIVTRIYDGQENRVTEYTQSEIIASVYDCMERTGKREGILFIDEINCVSETLAPTMLQFLQNKTFGSHRVPEGWMIVAAGNPRGYNKSAREFDVVTLDRVRKIEVEPELAVWMEYAWQHEVHGAILSYLNLKKEQFYFVENAAGEKQFVTARSWEDLSELLKSYEALGIPAGEPLMAQYLQREETARQFAAYYRLYCKYGEDYGITEILNGVIGPDGPVSGQYTRKVQMARQASFEERFTVIGLLLDGLGQSLAAYSRMDKRLVQLQEALKQFLDIRRKDFFLSDYVEERRNRLALRKRMELASYAEVCLETEVLQLLDAYDTAMKEQHLAGMEERVVWIRERFRADAREQENLTDAIHVQLSRAFRFASDCFGTEQELLLLVTGLTRNRNAAEFIAMNGCDEYLRYSELLLAEDLEGQDELEALLGVEMETDSC